MELSRVKWRLGGRPVRLGQTGVSEGVGQWEEGREEQPKRIELRSLLEAELAKRSRRLASEINRGGGGEGALHASKPPKWKWEEERVGSTENSIHRGR